MEKFFKFQERGTRLSTEIMAGITTFMTMAYIVFVNPGILSAAGVPFTGAVTATALGAALMCIAMGVFTNRPLALASGMGRIPDDAGGAGNPLERLLRKAYQEALKEKDKTMAGTALIAVERLSRDHAEFDRKKVEETALALATDERCGEASRITAMRICGMTGATNVLPSARITAQTGESVTLRMAAIATVGDLGGREDMELLKAMTRSSEKRLKTVAETSLGRLEKRMSQGQAEVTGH
jgi:hypothetical protein